MKLFSIVGHDAPGSAEKREEYLEPHLEHLRKLNVDGRLYAAGPIMKEENAESEACGSILIVKFNTLAEAEAWFDAEPYNQAGVYKTVSINLYLDALPYC